mgnify:CR=1 FL=1
MYASLFFLLLLQMIPAILVRTALLRFLRSVYDMMPYRFPSNLEVAAVVAAADPSVVVAVVVVVVAVVVVSTTTGAVTLVC